MPGGEAGSRRRRRRGRRGGGGAVAVERVTETPDQAEEKAAPSPPKWEWRTFPVFFAFVFGAFLILVIAPRPNTTFYAILFFVFLGATAFGLAHMATRAFVARRRR